MHACPGLPKKKRRARVHTQISFRIKAQGPEINPASSSAAAPMSPPDTPPTGFLEFFLLWGGRGLPQKQARRVVSMEMFCWKQVVPRLPSALVPSKI